jgi:hypothetical protein
LITHYSRVCDSSIDPQGILDGSGSVTVTGDLRVNSNDQRQSVHFGRRPKALDADSSIPQPTDVDVSTPPALALFQGELFLVYELTGGLWYSRFNLMKWFADNDAQWTKPKLVPNVGITGTPGLAAFDGVLVVAHRGGGDSNELWCVTCDHVDSEIDVWGTDTQVPNVYMSESPALAVYNDTLFLAHQGCAEYNTLDRVWYTTISTTLSGWNWSNDTYLPDVHISGSPSLTVFQGQLYLAHQGGNNELRYSTYSKGTSKGTWHWDTLIPNSAISTSPSLAAYPPNSKSGEKAVSYVYYQSGGQLFFTQSSDGASWAPRQAAAHILSGSPSIVVTKDPLTSSIMVIGVYQDPNDHGVKVFTTFDGALSL